MFHLVNSHIYQIFNDENIETLLKEKIIYEFGFKLGFNLAEEECLGYVKHCIPKVENKKDKT